MPITRQQANTALGRACRKIAVRYWEYDPNVTRAIIRGIVSEAKRVGTPAARNAARAVLREIYEDIYAEDAVSMPRFKEWIRMACTTQPAAVLGFPEHPFNNVSLDDGFDAQAGDTIS